MKFILRWMAIAVATFAAINLIPGIYPIGDNGYVAIAIFSLVLAAVNAVVKPIVKLLSLPLAIITLGIFYLVVNAMMLMLASWLSLNLFPSGVYVESFGDAFTGAIVIGIVSAIINLVTGANKKKEKEED